MSWCKARIYKCDICGDYYCQYKDDYGIFSMPFTWTGSSRKHGQCYCEKCTKALVALGEKLDGEQNA